MTVTLPLSRVDDRLDTLERWLIWLLPVALVTASGSADVLCTLLALLFVVRAAIRRDVSWIDRPWLKCLLALWLYLGLRSLFAIQPLHSLTQAVIWIRFPLFAVAVSHRLREAGTRDRLILIAACSLVALSADAIWQFVHGFDIIGHPIAPGQRLTGPFGRPYVGITIAWLFLPPLMGLIEHRRFWPAGALFCAALLAITLSGERMAFVIFSIDALMLGILLPSWRRVILIAAVAAVAVVAMLFVLKPMLLDRQLLSIGRTAATLRDSPYGVIWTRALGIVADSPLFGIGMDSYRTLCLDPKFGATLVGAEGFPHCSIHPHNFYIEWLLAGGVPLCLAVLACVGLLLRDLVRQGQVHNVVCAGLLASLVSRLWPLQPTTSFFYGWSAIPLFLYVGWALAYLPPAAPAKCERLRPTRARRSWLLSARR